MYREPVRRDADAGRAGGSLWRLGLSGRLSQAANREEAPDATGRPRSTSPTKPANMRAMPSLDDIRARLSKRGLDTTRSSAHAGGASRAESSSPATSPTKSSKALEPEAAEPTERSEGAAPLRESTQTVVNGALHKRAEDAKHGDDARRTEAPAKPPAVTEMSPPPNVAPKAAATHAPAPPAASDIPAGIAAGKAAKEGKATHPLQHAWTLYYDCHRQKHHGTASSEQYEATLKRVGHFTTLESFFDTFATLHRPSRLEKNANYHLFKDGVKPLWEDPANADGGRWVLTIREHGRGIEYTAAHDALVDRSWMWLVLALIGEQLDDGDMITGAVCSIRGRGDRIALWLRNKEPIEKVNALGEHLLQTLEIGKEPGVQLEFSINSGGKASSKYFGVQPHGGRNAQPADHTEPDPRSHENGDALGMWLGRSATLHPAEHMRVFPQLQAARGADGAQEDA